MQGGISQFMALLAEILSVWYLSGLKSSPSLIPSSKSSKNNLLMHISHVLCENSFSRTYACLGMADIWDQWDSARMLIEIERSSVVVIVSEFPETVL